MKKYITDYIKDEYMNWGIGKIFLQAPTGTGKTTFLVKKLLPYCKIREIKVLILCNRKLLRKQYWGQLTQEFDSYSELDAVVEVKTYQELAAMLVDGRNLRSLFSKFGSIFLDECHYFYSDSDFNGIGTYVLLHEIIYAGMLRQMVFISATMDCVQPLIEDVISNCADRYPEQLKAGMDFERARTIMKYDYDELADFRHINCKCVPDYETLCSLIGSTDKKSIIFIDDCKKAEWLAQYLIENDLARRNEIALLNAKTLDEESNRNTVEALTLANKLLPRILITTSVLDNGVSVHDGLVENICVLTESKVSFFQMIGRIRTEQAKKINLVFVMRGSEYFEKRVNDYERLKAFFPQGNRINDNSGAEFRIMSEIWDSQTESAEVNRTVYVPVPRYVEIFERPRPAVVGRFSGNTIVVNSFSKKKIEDMYLIESRLYHKAICDPINAIYEQMSWIHKRHTELEIFDSSFEKEQREKLISDLLEIQNYDRNELKRAKEEIAKKYKRNILSTYGLRNRAFSNDKFELILSEFGLVLVVSNENGKNRYSVQRKESM